MVDFLQDRWTNPPVAVATAAFGVFLVLAMLIRILIWNETPARKAAKAIPSVDEGYWESARIFLGPRAPMFVLDKARTLSKVFTMPFAPPGASCVFVVCDHKVAREVLETTSCKPALCYRPFNDMTGGESFFTVEGLRWRHVRKSLAPFFFKSIQILPHHSQLPTELD